VAKTAVEKVLNIEEIRRISTLNSFVNEIHSKLKAFADLYNLFGLLGLTKCDSPLFEALIYLIKRCLTD